MAQTKEEAGRWLSAIQMAMRNRFLYRRETLTGLSFLQEDGATDGASRPRILLLSLLRGGATTEAGDAAETVIARNAEWERAVALPPLLGSDRLLLTFVNGATAQLGGAEVVAHATSSSTQGDEERLKARVVGGGLAGSLLVSTTLVPQQQQESSPATTQGLVARALLSQPAHLLVPLVAAGGLLAAALASLTDRRTQVCLSSFRQACQELRFGTMVLVAAALTAHALLSLLLRVKAEKRAEERAQAERTGAAQNGPALAGIYLEVGGCLDWIGSTRHTLLGLGLGIDESSQCAYNSIIKPTSRWRTSWYRRRRPRGRRARKAARTCWRRSRSGTSTAASAT